MSKVHISKEEYLSAVMLHQPLTHQQARNYSALAVSAFILGCILWRYWPGSIAGGLVGGSIGGVIGYWIQRIFFVPWRAKMLYEQHRALKEAVEFSWSPNGLSAKAETASSQTPWSHYLRWRENQDVYNLYHSDHLYQIVPKRIFQTPEEIEAFRKYLASVRNA